MDHPSSLSSLCQLNGDLKSNKTAIIHSKEIKRKPCGTKLKPKDWLIRHHLPCGHRSLMGSDWGLGAGSSLIIHVSHVEFTAVIKLSLKIRKLFLPQEDIKCQNQKEGWWFILRLMNNLKGKIHKRTMNICHSSNILWLISIIYCMSPLLGCVYSQWCRKYNFSP